MSTQTDSFNFILCLHFLQLICLLRSFFFCSHLISLLCRLLELVLLSTSSLSSVAKPGIIYVFEQGQSILKSFHSHCRSFPDLCDWLPRNNVQNVMWVGGDEMKRTNSNCIHGLEEEPTGLVHHLGWLSTWQSPRITTILC